MEPLPGGSEQHCRHGLPLRRFCPPQRSDGNSLQRFPRLGWITPWSGLLQVLHLTRSSSAAPPQPLSSGFPSLLWAPLRPPCPPIIPAFNLQPVSPPNPHLSVLQPAFLPEIGIVMCCNHIIPVRKSKQGWLSDFQTTH